MAAHSKKWLHAFYELKDRHAGLFLVDKRPGPRVEWLGQRIGSKASGLHFILAKELGQNSDCDGKGADGVLDVGNGLDFMELTRVDVSLLPFQVVDDLNPHWIVQFVMVKGNHEPIIAADDLSDIYLFF